MQEFICPNGRMSVNGVCPMFENDVSQQIETFENNPFKQPFKFDFEKETPSSKKNAFDIIGENINAYDSFVQDKLGISPGVQNVARVGSAISGFGTYGVVGAIAPFAIPFAAGAALNMNQQNQQQAAINRESVRDLQGRIDAGQFGSTTATPQDARRGGQYAGGDGGGSSSSGASSGGGRDAGMGMGGKER